MGISAVSQFFFFFFSYLYLFMVSRAYVKFKDTHSYTQTLGKSGEPTVPLWEGNVFPEPALSRRLMFPECWDCSSQGMKSGVRSLLVLRGRSHLGEGRSG